MATQKPVHQERIGRIVAAVWENPGEHGTFYSATFARIFHNGDDWRRTSSFNRRDLLDLAKLADMIDTWILMQDLRQRVEADTQSAEPDAADVPF